MTKDRPQINVDTGEFPYPITGGPEESRYLTWIRNHSNYMAERGFLDYLRLAAVLVRGIVLNFLTLLPYLLVAAMALSLAYRPLLQQWGQLRPAIRGTLAGDWRVGDEITTTLTAEDGSTEWVVTRIKNDEDRIPGKAVAPTVESVRKHHKKDLETATGLFDKIRWSTSGVDAIMATTVEGVEPISISSAVESTSGSFTYPHVGSPTSYIVTPWVLALAGAWILLFPILSRLSKVVGYRRTLETGRTSSIKMRDLFERSFGGLLLLVIAGALIESLPLLVHHFHQIRQGGLGSLALPTVVGAVGVLAAANNVLPLLGGIVKKLAMVLVGALGILIPLLVVVVVVEFIVYAHPYTGFLIYALFFLPLLIALGIISTLVLGIGSLKGKGVGKLFTLLAGILGLFIAIFVLCVVFLGEEPSPYWNLVFVLAWTVEIWLFCWLSVDVNLTSINGLYRDRLASAFLVGVDTEGDVDIEEDVDLQEICHYDAGSTAPYHLVNVAHNLQGSRDIAVRDRNSDFFIFSKKFIGSARTGYCRSENMELVYPQVDLGTAMAISAAAASPNMGRSTNPLMTAFMTLLNVRLGYWLPNPGRLEEHLEGNRKRFEKDVFPEELLEIERRREQAYQSKTERPLAKKATPGGEQVLVEEGTIKHGLVGIGFSGGGIRSATINLGITQALHMRGVLDHIDYMSTVSGGGYLGSSISTLMRYKTKPVSEIAGTVSVETTPANEKVVRISKSRPEVREYRLPKDAELDVTDGDRVKAGQRLSKELGSQTHSEIAGVVSVDTDAERHTIVRVTDKQREYLFSGYVELDERIKDGAQVEAGQRLLKRICGVGLEHSSLWNQFLWRVRPGALFREMLSKLDETHRWVNCSDGGHIENLATIELLRRRCKFIITGDGEADPNLYFNGLATLIRYARIDLGIDIHINLDAIRLDKSQDAIDQGIDDVSREHWALGTITYPADEESGCEEEQGFLLYLKSSYTGDEDEVIGEYRHRKPAFPHESTADQFFDEGQFEAYRALGQHIGESALGHAPGDGRMSFSDLEEWFKTLGEVTQPKS